MLCCFSSLLCVKCTSLKKKGFMIIPRNKTISSYKHVAVYGDMFSSSVYIRKVFKYFIERRCSSFVNHRPRSQHRYQEQCWYERIDVAPEVFRLCIFISTLVWSRWCREMTLIEELIALFVFAGWNGRFRVVLIVLDILDGS